MARRGGERLELVVAVEHVGDVDGDGEHLARLEILVEVRAVGGEHQRTRRRHHAHALQAAAVAAKLVHGDARGDLAVPVMEHHPARVDVAHHLAHVVGGEWVAQVVVAHAGAGGVGHLGGLQMEAGLGERRHGAGMVVMQVRDDELLQARGRNADHLQGRRRRARDLAPALGALGCIEAAVDDDGAVGVADHPDEVVDGVRAIVVVGRDEALETAAAGELAVFDGEDFVGLGGHGRLPVADGPACASDPTRVDRGRPPAPALPMIADAGGERSAPYGTQTVAKLL